MLADISQKKLKAQQKKEGKNELNVRIKMCKCPNN